MRLRAPLAALLLGCAGAPAATPAADVPAIADTPVSTDTAVPTDIPVTTDTAVSFDTPVSSDIPDAAAPALTFALFAIPDNTPANAELFVAGTFNDWNPRDPRHRLTRDALGVYRASVPGLSEGAPVEYKFTRGSWATVERDDDGNEVPNRRTSYAAARPVVAGSVARWADLGRAASTRSGDVRVLRDVAIPQLGVARDVWVYLPRGYATTELRYPVVYMLDGQNLFDARAAAFGREWGVDEAAETLALEGDLPGLIVVGLANSAARGCEYNVFVDDPHPACADRTALGDRTVAFLADTLKPMIDGMFRTLPGRESTAVAGSSMGGSMAVRAGVTRSDVFSRVAALSPSYQNVNTAPVGMPGAIRARPPAMPLRVHQDMGSAERIRELDAATLTRNMEAVRDALRATGTADAAQRAVVVPGATHDEAAWSRRITEVLRWLWR